jgi:hypothetical protein
MQMNMCPFKGIGKLSKLFWLFPQDLNLPARSDTPAEQILRGIRPHGISPARFQTLQNNGRVVYIVLQTLVLRTLQNKVLQALPNKS